MNNNWIPVTERLPDIPISPEVKIGAFSDNGIDFLVSYSDGEVNVTTFWAKARRFDDCHEDVTAWMPLPEPYKPEGNAHDN